MHITPADLPTALDYGFLGYRSKSFAIGGLRITVGISCVRQKLLGDIAVNDRNQPPVP